MKSGGEIFLRDGLNLKIKRKAAIQARHSHLFRRLAAILQKKDAHVSRKIAPADTFHRLRVADTERMLPQIHEDLLRGVCRSELSGAEAEWLSGGEGGLSSSSSCSRGPRANSTTLHIISSWRLSALETVSAPTAARATTATFLEDRAIFTDGSLR